MNFWMTVLSVSRGKGLERDQSSQVDDRLWNAKKPEKTVLLMMGGTLKPFLSPCGKSQVLEIRSHVFEFWHSHSLA